MPDQAAPEEPTPESGAETPGATAAEETPAAVAERDDVAFSPEVRAYLERGKPTPASIAVSCVVSILGAWVPVALIAIVIALTGHKVMSPGFLVAWAVFTLFGLILLLLLVRQAMLTGRDLSGGTMVRVRGTFDVQPFSSRGGRGYALEVDGERVALAPAAGDLVAFTGTGEADYLRHTRTLVRFSGTDGAGWVNPGFAPKAEAPGA